jgi:hypothetical protein
MKKWSKKIIVEKITQLQELDIDLSAQFIRKHEPTLYRAGGRYYSSWAKALKAAGAGYPLSPTKGT